MLQLQLGVGGKVWCVWKFSLHKLKQDDSYLSFLTYPIILLLILQLNIKVQDILLYLA